MGWEKEVEKLNQCGQRQDSLVNQLEDLVTIADKLGFYDASTLIREVHLNDK